MFMYSIIKNFNKFDPLSFAFGMKELNNKGFRNN